MEKQLEKKEITKEGYKLMVWGCIIIGLIGTCIFYVLANFISQPNAYYISFMSLCEMLIGYGLGLAIAHSYNIKGINK